MNKQPLKKVLIVGSSLVLVLLLVFAFKLTTGSVLGGIDNTDIKQANVSVGNYTCGATSSVALAAQSGRTWLRLSNASVVDVYIALAPNATSSFPATTGIRLSGLYSTSSGSSYFDTNEAGIDWSGMVRCIANTTGSVVSYIQSF